MPTPSPAAVLTAAAVRVAGERTILGPLSLEIAVGEHWALLGPNGAGKTTLLSLLGAERQPIVGTVEVLGAQLGRVDLRELRRRIGVVGHRVAERLPPAVSALEIVLTGRDGLLAPWWGSFEEPARAEARALLAVLGCDALAAQPFGACSQGERQRVLLARALATEAPVLLLDEPGTHLDPPHQVALARLCRELGRTHTVVTVQHDLALALHADRVLLLRDGCIGAFGAHDDPALHAALVAAFGGAIRIVPGTAPGERALVLPRL